MKLNKEYDHKQHKDVLWKIRRPSVECAEVKLVGTPPKITSQCEERFEQSFDAKNSIEDWTGI